MLETVEGATAHALQLYAAAFPQRKHIHILSEVNVYTGWEGTSFALQLGYEEDRRDYTEPVLLKCYHGQGGQQKGYTEWIALRQLAQYHYPVPTVLATSFEYAPLEQACVLMECIQGPSMGKIFRSTPQEEHFSLHQYFCQIQVMLHTADWQMFVPDPDDYSEADFLKSHLAEERTFVEQSLPHLFTPTFDWLDKRCAQIPESCLALIHGDFHLNNVLIRPDGHAVVIDWTGFDISDYRMDLARTLLIMHLNMPDGWMKMHREIYEQIYGQKIEHLEYFEAIACIDRLTNMLITLRHNGTVIGLNPETVKQYTGQVRQISLFLQERTGQFLPALEHEIVRLDE